MDETKTLDAQCPTCSKRTEHEVLAGRSGPKTFQGTVRCVECGTTHPTTLRRSPRVRVGVVVSRDAESKRLLLDFRADDLVKIGDELFLDEGRVLVSSVEISGDRRVQTARASDVVTVWTKAFDLISVKVNVTLGERTVSRLLPKAPEDEITVGEVLKWPDLEASVFQIKTADHRIRKGSALAREAQRVYAKAHVAFMPPEERTPPRRGSEAGATPRRRADRRGAAEPQAPRRRSR